MNCRLRTAAGYYNLLNLNIPIGTGGHSDICQVVIAQPGSAGHIASA